MAVAHMAAPNPLVYTRDRQHAVHKDAWGSILHPALFVSFLFLAKIEAIFLLL